MPRHFATIGRLSLFTLSLSCAVLASAEPATSTWPMYQGNASHTGYVPVSLIPNQFALRWTRTFGPAALNPAAAADGKIFFTENGYFGEQHAFALDAATGKSLWSLSYVGISNVNPPSYGEGVVYLQTVNHSNDTYLRAYSADTGEFLYRTPHGAQWEHYYAPTLFDHKVYVNGGYYGGMYAFDAASGDQLWYRELPQYDKWTPAVDQDFAYAYLGNSSGQYAGGLYAVNRATGELTYTIPDPTFDWSGWSMDLAPVIGAMDDVLVIHDGRLISFDTFNHQIRWQIPSSFRGQPALAKNVIYAIEAGALSARDEGTGARLWMWEPPTGQLVGTVLATDTHVFVSNGSATYAVALASHRSDWSYPVGGTLSLSEGRLLITGYDATVTSVATVSGRITAPVSKLQFRKVAVGSTSTQSVTLQNTGSGPLVINAVTGLRAPYQLANPALPVSIEPGATLNLEFAFSPARKRRERQQVTLLSDDPTRPHVKIALDGTGVRKRR